MAHLQQGPNWLDIAKATRMNAEQRCISKDSDGNPCRVAYPNGVEAEAARAAEQAAMFGGQEAAIDAMLAVFSQREIQINDKVHTS